MTQLSPQTIRALSIGSKPLITPLADEYKHYSGLSGGMSCAGYDVHMDSDLAPVKGFKQVPWWDDKAEHWILPPRTGCLANTLEKFHLPPNIAMHYYNKSSLARKFLNACATLGEPGWCGNLTLELYNQTDDDFILYPGQPIGQVVFLTLDHASVQPYNGKYQNQAATPVQAR